jgi:hypothetical protein
LPARERTGVHERSAQSANSQKDCKVFLNIQHSRTSPAVNAQETIPVLSDVVQHAASYEQSSYNNGLDFASSLNSRAGLSSRFGFQMGAL